MPPDDRFPRSGLLLLAIALAFNALFLAPELGIGRVPLNDAVLHLAAAERIGASLESGEPLLDPWVSEWSLGYPVWRSYQPLPHLAAALWLRALDGFSDHASAFALLQYLLLVLLPASVYVGARRLGIGPIGAGLASILVLAPNGQGEFGRYGLGYGPLVWRGSGLFTQLVALHFFVLSLGTCARALDVGKGRLAAAALLAATALSHIVFAYAGFVSALVLAVVGATGERPRRLVRFATIVAAAAVLLFWFYVPLALVIGEVNHSRWESLFKWNSFGAPVILRELLSGRLLDAGRWPVLSLLAAAGVIAAGMSFREPLARRLLALAAVWLALYFGRDTWGHLLLLAGVPSDFHLHRLQAALEVSLVLVAAFGAERAIVAAWRRNRWLAIIPAIVIAAAVVVAGLDRAKYLRENGEWGEKNLAAYEHDRADLDAALADVRAILAERPGRVSAGKAASWGNRFKIGDVPVYAFLTREHIDEASFLYHSMSLTSDLMALRDENELTHDVVFGVRAVLAPAGQAMPAHLRSRGAHGRFVVYESSAEGYFGLVDIGARYTGGKSTAYEPSAAWLKSELPRSGIVVALDGEKLVGPPAVGRWEPFPRIDSALQRPRGRIVSETKLGETFTAHLALDRPCYALVKMTWFPGLVATVDGRPEALVRVTPGFAAVSVPGGEHVVAVRYQPGPLKRSLLVAGLAVFAVFAIALSRPGFAAVEGGAESRLRQIGEALSTPRLRTAAAFAVLALLALRPLFRGLLVDGHDALEYPPRLVEMARVLADGQFPPIWAPDLGAGFGQPLFEFAPPAVYLVAAPLWCFGLKLADSLQLALAILHVLGAVAVYRLGRRAGGARIAALVGATAWLFGPYLALDLYVRSAFAEAAAVATAPIALLALLRAIDRPSAKRVAGGAVGIALVLLAHNGAALLLLPAFALVAAAACLASERRLAATSAGAATIATGLGVGAFFWLPAFAERGFVKTDLLREGFLHWSEHAISPWQLVSLAWGYGYSVPGTADGMSFQLGLAQLVLGLAGLLAITRCTRRTEAFALATIAAIGAWLATAASSSLWTSFQPIQYLAYPWRALMLPALALPLLAVAASARLGDRGSVAALALIVITNLSHTEPKGYLAYDDEFFSAPSIAAKGINTTTREEYEPRSVETRPPYSPRRLVGIAPGFEIRDQQIGTARQEFSVHAPSAGRAIATTFYYPGWTALVDGKPVPVTAAPKFGAMLFDFTAGTTKIVLELRATPVRRTGMLITAISLAILAIATTIGEARRNVAPRDTTPSVQSEKLGDGNEAPLFGAGVRLPAASGSGPTRAQGRPR